MFKTVRGRRSSPRPVYTRSPCGVGDVALGRPHGVLQDAILSGMGVDDAISHDDRPTLHTRLLQELRSELMRPTGDEATAIATLKVAWALEAALGAVVGEDPDDLRARMVQFDALELLVEIAHDLRSPLASILFLAEALRDGFSGEINAVQRSQLGLIHAAALALGSTTSDIVDLAGRRPQHTEIERQSYFLSEVFGQVERLVRPLAEEMGLQLRVRVPESDRSHGDPAAVGRVLLNLVTNALKFTEHGFVEMGVRRLSSDREEFYVQDTGRGISEERQAVLFQPFRSMPQGEGHLFSGSGVGLSIARRIVRSMGSELELETSPADGTRFSFVL